MTFPVRILIIEDDLDYIELLKHMFDQLTDVYECDYVSTYQEGLDGVTQGGHDIYFVDYLLDLGNTGDSLIDEAARRAHPVVMLSGVDDFKLRERMIRAGATDFLVKNKITCEHIDLVLRKSLPG